MKVAAYCRISTNLKENSKSLETQIQYYLETIVNKPGWELVGIYADKGISASSTRNRNAFNRLMRHCEEGRIDLILTKSISRFSRNTADFLNALRTLQQHKVDILFEKEGMRLSETDNEFMYTIFAAAAQNESVSLAENIEWSLEQRFLNGQAKSAPILGYDMYWQSGEKKIEIIDKEATIVRKIYSLYLEGHPISKICQYLASEQYQTKSGHLNWYPNHVKYILMNQRYTGDVLTRPTPSRIADMRPNRQRRSILIKNSYPQIVDYDTYKTVQTKLESRKNGRPQTKGQKHVLSSRLICGRCGKAFAKHHKVQQVQIWNCRLKLDNQRCQAEPVSETDLLTVIQQAFTRRFANREPLNVSNILEALNYQTIIDNYRKKTT